MHSGILKAGVIVSLLSACTNAGECPKTPDPMDPMVPETVLKMRGATARVLRWAVCVKDEKWKSIFSGQVETVMEGSELIAYVSRVEDTSDCAQLVHNVLSERIEEMIRIEAEPQTYGTEPSPGIKTKMTGGNGHEI